MVVPEQGDIYWVKAEDQRRPALVVTRSQGIPVLNRVIVAPITRRIRGIGTEVRLDTTSGLREPSVASFDNLLILPKAVLTEKIGELRHPRLEICRALGALADC